MKISKAAVILARLMDISEADAQKALDVKLAHYQGVARTIAYGDIIRALKYEENRRTKKAA